MDLMNSEMCLLVDKYNPTVLGILETSLNAIISNFLIKYSVIYVCFNAWSKLKWQFAYLNVHLLINVKCCPFA